MEQVLCICLQEAVASRIGGDERKARDPGQEESRAPHEREDFSLRSSLSPSVGVR
jgi:hypothetical protein